MARDGRDGRNGRDGAPGLPGPIPRHEWDGTRIRFQKTDNTWGEWVDIQGIQGKDGLNNYELAVKAGYIGSLEDWLLSIRGEDGQSAYSIAVEDGFSGSITEWILSLKGAKGERGPRGVQGERGETGPDGPQGRDGVDGLSAYEIWLKDHEGTEQDFFNWLADKVKSAVRETSQGGGPLRIKLKNLTDVNVDGVTDGQFLKYDAASKKWIPGTGGGGSGAVDSVNGQTGVVVLDIADIGGVVTDATLTGDGTPGDPLSVATVPTAPAWGDITGTLSDQTDLNTALGTKANTADLGAVAFSNDYNDLDNLPDLNVYAPLASPTFTGTVTLPAGQEVNGVTLATGGSSTAYLSQDGTYTTPAGGGTPGGSDTQIQFNDGGAFGGDADFTWNKTTKLLSLTGTQAITATSTTALAVGQNGATNPAFAVDTNTASSATGVVIQSRASGTSTVGMTATSSAGSCDLVVSSKGLGILDLNGGSSGSVRINPGGATRITISSTVFTGSTSLTNYIFGAGASNTAATVRFLYTAAADAALTAGANAIAVHMNLGATRTHASNTAIALQQDMLISGSTHAFVTAGGVITNCAALAITGPDSGGTNATITNSHGLYIPTKAVSNVTNASGLTIDAPTGGTTNNYAARLNGLVQMSAGQIAAIRVVTAGGAVTVSATDYTVVINKTSGAATAVSLPTPSTANTGQVFRIKDGKGDAGTNNITITPVSGLIDGVSNYVIATNKDYVTVQSDGSNYWIV